MHLLQMRLYKWAFFLTSSSLWLSAAIQYTLLARKEYKTVDTREFIYQLAHIPMALGYIFASTLDLLVLWSFYKLDKKVSIQMRKRVTANLQSSK